MKKRIFFDKIAGKSTFVISALPILLVIFLIIQLTSKSWPIIEETGLNKIIIGSDWHPTKKMFGFLPFIMGSFYVTFISIVIAAPFCLLTAIYLNEYASKRIYDIIVPFIDVLAGIPSVVYGLWGIIVIVPIIKDFIAPFFGIMTAGYCILTGGIVLAIMIAPIIILVSVEMLKTVPFQLREAALSLGATHWETIKLVVLRKAFKGIAAGIILAISRAFGETMAVLMVVGNVVKIPENVFEQGYPLPALIANNFGEMMSIPLYDSALMTATLILLLIVILFNIISRIFILKVTGKI
ncbi:phosphate ABC transporter permease subunit PstC [Candidatus Dependentiae bacterium]|nr:phosphate ABC transporter permease subunit PstC [Candidatus Dependentiae bacterium]